MKEHITPECCLLFTLFLCAIPDAQTNWKVSSKPVISSQVSPGWTKWKSDPCVIQENDRWIMYYGTNDLGVLTQIGRATSSDGRTWVADTSQVMVPTGPPGAWDDANVETPFVIIDSAATEKERYKMWYSGNGNAGDNKPQNVYQIGYACSPDGINWTKYNIPANDSDSHFIESDPVLPIPAFKNNLPEIISYDSWTTGEPSVVMENGIYNLYYIGLGMEDTVFAHRVAKATSKNGCNWTKQSVVFEPSFEGVEATGIMCPAVVKYNKEYLLFYSMVELPYDSFANIERGRIGLAKSQDGISFSRVAKNPIISHGLKESYYRSGVFAPAPLPDEQKLFVYFSSIVYDPGVPIFEPYIGYAELDAPNNSLPREMMRPPEILLSIKNHPNPFKANTIIQYSILNHASVTIRIFSIKGELISTLLLTEQQKEGMHTVIWDGRGDRGKRASSGHYFCRISFDGNTKIKTIAFLY